MKWFSDGPIKKKGALERIQEVYGFFFSLIYRLNNLDRNWIKWHITAVSENYLFSLYPYLNSKFDLKISVLLMLLLNPLLLGLSQFYTGTEFR